MIRLRHWDMVAALCAAWVGTMGLSIHLSGVWFGTESFFAGRHAPRASNGSGGGRLVPALPGAPTALSLAGNPRLHTGESAANAPSRRDSRERPAFESLARSAAALCGVPAPILFALIERESSWRQTHQGRTLRSSSGALGLTQIKPGSAREISPTLDPHTAWGNLLAGACYLSKHRRGASWGVALLRYRLGPYHRRSTLAARAYVADIIGGAE